MREAEHVTGLVREHLAAPAQQKCLVTGRTRFAIKCRIVPGKAVNTDTVAQRRLPKDEIPRRLRVKVFHGDGENAEGIGGNAGLEEVEDVAGENLRIAGVRIAARGELRV